MIPEVMIVYIYTFPNGKRYVGQTVQQFSSRTGTNGIKYSNQLVGKAIEKYGWDNIEKEIIECSSQEEMDALEIALIAEYKTTEREFGYNLEIGGGHPHQLSEEHKQHIAETMKARGYKPPSFEGKHHTEEAKQRIRAAKLGEKNPMFGVEPWNKGGSHTEEAKQKMRENNRLNKPVRCVETGEIFISGNEAARAKGLHSLGKVREAANNPSKTAAGYHWEWA